MLDTTRMSQPLQVLLSHEATEWYTPARYVALVRRVMGGIDLDPASSLAANQTVQARKIYTEADNGLVLPWQDRVWLNPPYSKTAGRSNQEIWAEKLIEEFYSDRVSEAILLVKASLGYAWFKKLFQTWPVCLAYDLISFERPGGGKPKPAKLGSAFFYFGPNYRKFEAVFSEIGRVIPAPLPAE